MRPATPRGFRDVLAAEAEERSVLVSRVMQVFSAWGYGRVETPVVERIETIEAAAGPLEGTAFRLVDLDGRLLALRPDLTVPIARLVATRLAEQPGPFRLCYAAEAFREHESLRGQSRQFTQLGVEFVGPEGPAADAEVVAILVEGLREAGLNEFTVALGSVGVLNAIVDAAGMPNEWRDAVLTAAHERNLVELARLAGIDGVDPAAARALATVPSIRGGREAIRRCREVAGDICGDTLADLELTFALLDAAGVSDSVIVDFSVMRSFDYYTGMVFEAYAPGVGLPLAGGGRYDGVLAKLGAPAAAAGFALGLERLAIALVEQKVSIPVRGVDFVVGGDPAERMAQARELRRRGCRVMLSYRMGADLVDEARALGAPAVALEAAGGTLFSLDAEGSRQGGYPTMPEGGAR